MRVSSNTKDLIARAKAEVSQQKRELIAWLVRLDELPGTKKETKKLSKVIGELERWQNH